MGGKNLSSLHATQALGSHRAGSSLDQWRRKVLASFTNIIICYQCSPVPEHDIRGSYEAGGAIFW